MGKGMLAPGMKWSRVEYLGSEIERRVEESGGIAEVSKEEKLEFRCDCGRLFGMWATDWPGKRRTRDCGCGLAREKEVMVNVGCYLPQGLVRRMDERVYTEHGSRSQVIRELVSAWVGVGEVKNDRVKKGKRK